MAVATEPLTPTNHLPLEPTGLTPSFGGTPGFFSAEFGNLNPFDLDFNNATSSPLRVETSGIASGTPPGHVGHEFREIPRSVLDVAMRRNYDPSLVPTPGPRVSEMRGFKGSGLKEVSTIGGAGGSRTKERMPPSPQRSPNALDPAFLEKEEEGQSGYVLPPPAVSTPGYGSSRGIHGEVTPPTEDSNSPEEKEVKSTNAKGKAKGNAKKRKAEDLDSDTKAQSPITSKESNTTTTLTKKKPDSEDSIAEVKRKKFLERNRLAASKCRQKKKEWANNLEDQARYQAQENKLLRASVTQLRDECLYLKNFLLSMHSGCNCMGVKNYLLKEAQMSQQVANLAAAGGLPIASLVHPGWGMHPHVVGNEEDRRRSLSVVSGVTMSEGRTIHQGSMSPQQ